MFVDCGNNLRPKVSTTLYDILVQLFLQLVPPHALGLLFAQRNLALAFFQHTFFGLALPVSECSISF